MVTVLEDTVDVLVRRVPYPSLHILCDDARSVDGDTVDEYIANTARVEVQRRIIVAVRPFLAPNTVDDFLSVLAEFNTVVCGILVLEVIDPAGLEHAHTLDLIVPEMHYWRVFQHLVDVQGCTSSRRLHYIPGLSPAGYEHAAELVSTQGVFRLICSPANTPLYTIPYFYSTHLMNYLSCDHICVAYPQLTFARQGIEVFPSVISTSFTVADRDAFFPDLAACIPPDVCGGRDRMFDDEFCAITTFRDGYTSHGTVVWKLGVAKCCEACDSVSRIVLDL